MSWHCDTYRMHKSLHLIQCSYESCVVVRCEGENDSFLLSQRHFIVCDVHESINWIQCSFTGDDSYRLMADDSYRVHKSSLMQIRGQECALTLFNTGVSIKSLKVSAKLSVWPRPTLLRTGNVLLVSWRYWFARARPTTLKFSCNTTVYEGRAESSHASLQVLNVAIGEHVSPAHDLALVAILCQTPLSRNDIVPFPSVKTGYCLLTQRRQNFNSKAAFTHTGFLPAPATAPTPAPACGFSHTQTLPESSDSLFSSATEEKCVLILIHAISTV